MTAIDRRSAVIAVAGSLTLVGAARATAPRGADRDTLERLLSLERELESAYDAALRRSVVEDDIAELLRDHAREYASGLERALAGRPRVPLATVPSPALARALDGGRRSFLRHALGMESEAVGAYADAVAGLRDPGLLQGLGSIMAGTGQHLVLLRRELGLEPASVAFETGRHPGAR